MGETQELVTRLASTMLSPRLEFPNSKISPILLGGIVATLECTLL